ncbi:MAG: hypothetical protein ACLQOO_07015 [Terriglobia bacterium]
MNTIAIFAMDSLAVTITYLAENNHFSFMDSFVVGTAGPAFLPSYTASSRSAIVIHAGMRDGIGLLRADPVEAIIRGSTAHNKY